MIGPHSAEPSLVGRVEIMVKAKSQFKRRSTANNVEIYIPVPSDADSPKFKTTLGNGQTQPLSDGGKMLIKCDFRPLPLCARAKRSCLEHQVIPGR